MFAVFAYQNKLGLSPCLRCSLTKETIATVPMFAVLAYKKKPRTVPMFAVLAYKKKPRTVPMFAVFAINAYDIYFTIIHVTSVYSVSIPSLVSHFFRR